MKPPCDESRGGSEALQSEAGRHADGLADIFCANLDVLARRGSHS